MADGQRCSTCTWCYPKNIDTRWRYCIYGQEHTPRPGPAKPDVLQVAPDDGEQCPVWKQDADMEVA